MILNFKERFTAFRKNIANIIDEYLGEILNKINVEKISLENILNEQKRKIEEENVEKKEKNKEILEKYEKLKKENKEKKEKWDKICQEYDNVKSLINEILNEKPVQEVIEKREKREGEEAGIIGEQEEYESSTAEPD